MRVAVIVVNFNDSKDTIKYVEQIVQYQTINRIVVVDNGSTERNEMERLRGLASEKVVVLQADKNGGYNYGNNFGICYLEQNGERYDYLVISNPDIEIEEKAISECLQVLEENQDVAIVAPRMVNADGKPVRRSSWKMRTFALDVVHSTRLLELLFYSKLRKGEYAEKEYAQKCLQVEAISGAFCVMKQEIWQQIGGFDENVFLFYEEDILAKKVQEIGKKIVSVNHVKFCHYESQAIGKTLSYYRKMQQLYQSKLYYQKQYNQIKAWQIAVFQILNWGRKIELLLEIPLRKILKK